MATLASTITAAAVLLGATQSKAPPVKFEWNVGTEDVYDMKWTYQKTTSFQAGVSTKSTQSRDRRSVTAVLTPNKDETLGGELQISFEKATWDIVKDEYTIVVTYSSKNKKPISSRIKVHAKKEPRGLAANLTPDQIRRRAQREEEAMKRSMEGKFTLNTVTHPRQAFTLHNGRQSGLGNSILGVLYIQAAETPNGSIPRGQKWKEANIRGRVPGGVAKIEVIEYVVSSVSSSGATAKAGLQVPFRIPPTGRDKIETSGKFTYGCSFTFAPEGYVSGSKEFLTFVKKVDAKERIYEQNYNVSIKQQFTLKKRKPPKKKAEEKK